MLYVSALQTLLTPQPYLASFDAQYKPIIIAHSSAADASRRVLRAMPPPPPPPSTWQVSEAVIAIPITLMMMMKDKLAVLIDSSLVSLGVKQPMPVGTQ